MLTIAFSLLSDMALIAMVAYLIGRSQYIVACVNKPTVFRHWLTLTSIFSLLSILGTYNGIPVEGALANTRLVGTLMSGIMGGPTVGLSVGIVSGLHRYLVGGFTAETCGVAAVLGGLFAGLIRHKIGLHNMTWKTAAWVALVSEIAQKMMVLLFAKPFEAAWALESIIAIPTTAITILGTVIFMFIIKDIQFQQEASSAKSAELALQIASLTLPYLRQGLNRESAAATAEIIHRLTKLDAVSITDQTTVLAFVGLGSDHHQAGEPLCTESTKQTLAGGQVTVLHNSVERGCPVANCPLNSGVVAPLIVHGTTVGTIKLSSAEKGEVSESTIKIANGIAELLSVQIELAEIDAQRKMREKAELKALRAQINPHFLFNTLNIIMSLCRTNPLTARDLLNHLAVIMQYSFSNHGDFVTLALELEGIKSYLEIVKARFGSRLTVNFDIEESVLTTPIPVLSIQPLVENAVHHGLFPKLTECHLAITVSRQPDGITISVADNGVGIAPAKLQHLFTAETESVGIQNVYKRLQAVYGPSYGLTIDSKLGDGTTATIQIPQEKVVIDHAS